MELVVTDSVIAARRLTATFDGGTRRRSGRSAGGRARRLGSAIRGHAADSAPRPRRDDAGRAVTTATTRVRHRVARLIVATSVLAAAPATARAQRACADVGVELSARTTALARSARRPGHAACARRLAARRARPTRRRLGRPARVLERPAAARSAGVRRRRAAAARTRARDAARRHERRRGGRRRKGRARADDGTRATRRRPG